MRVAEIICICAGCDGIHIDPAPHLYASRTGTSTAASGATKYI